MIKKEIDGEIFKILDLKQEWNNLININN